MNLQSDISNLPSISPLESASHEGIQGQEGSQYVLQDTVLIFDDMSLKEPVLRGIYANGYEKPSEFQQKAVPSIISGKDLVGLSNSGTGKTVSYAIGALQLLDPSIECCQILILVMSRELASGVNKLISNLGLYFNLKTRAFVGGTSIADDLRALEAGVQIAVGTPGRILHLVSRKALTLDKVKLFVLDDIMELLSRGFQEQIDELSQYLGHKVQRLIFSSALISDIPESILSKLVDPTHIVLFRKERTLNGVKQYYVNIEREEWKYDTLCDFYSSFAICQSIIYCNTKRKVLWLAEQLGTTNDAFGTLQTLHGDMTKEERKDVIRNYRHGAIRTLISVDQVSIDLDVAVVLNYDLPSNMVEYLARVGRFGSEKVVAVNFIVNNELNYIHQIESYYQTTIEEFPVDTLPDFLEK